MSSFGKQVVSQIKSVAAEATALLLILGVGAAGIIALGLFFLFTEN